MRDLFRLLIVAAMSLAVVGITMMYSRGGDLNSAVTSVTAGISDAVADVSDRIGGTPAPASTEGYHFSLSRLEADRWAGLAGFPDQSEVRFPLPQGGHYLSGVLTLDFDTQLTAHGDGLMTLSVNGTTRGQVVLDSGRATHQVRIALTPADLGSDSIVLTMAGRGNTGQGQVCPTDVTNAGSAVTLSADSRLELTSDVPLEDAIGGLVAAPRPFVLTADQNDTGAAFAIWANQQLNRSGIQSRLGHAGPGETPITVSDHTAASTAVTSGNGLAGQAAVNQLIARTGNAAVLPSAWPVSVADLDAETTVKTFRGSRRWTIAFNAADLPGGALPEQFNLRLATTPLAGGNQWLVRVSLNGNLVDTQRIVGNVDTIIRSIALATERLLPKNSLVVELVDTTPNEGTCARLPDAQAQLLPESGFSDTVSASVAWAALIESLAESRQISISAGTALSLIQSGRASDLLSAVLPRSANLSFDGQGTLELTISDLGNLAQQLNRSADNMGIKAIVPTAAGGNVGLAVVSVPSAEFGAAVKRLGPDDVIILATGL